MMKLTTFASVLLALGLLGAGSTSGQDGRQECLKQVAESLVSRSVPEDVAGLVEAIRKAKPDFIDYDYDVGLERFDDVDYEPIDSTGCSSLFKMITKDKATQCIKSLEPLGQFYLDLVAVDEGVRPIAEAFAACSINTELHDLRGEDDWACAKAAAEFLIPGGTEEIASLLPDDVVQLTDALKADTRNIMTVFEGDINGDNFEKFQPIAPAPAGCDKLEERVNGMFDKVDCCEKQDDPFRVLVLAVPQLRPVVEAIIACSVNRILLDSKSSDSE